MIKNSEHAKRVQLRRHALGLSGLAGAVKRFNARNRAHVVTGPRHEKRGTGGSPRTPKFKLCRGPSGDRGCGTKTPGGRCVCPLQEMMRGSA